MKRIIISQRIDVTDTGETRDSLDQNWFFFLQETFGKIELIQVSNVCRSLNWLESIKPDLIVLSGGNDIGQYPSRDNVERQLLEYSKLFNIPLLGFCRGAQFIARNFNAEFVDLDTKHIARRHELKLNAKLSKYRKENYNSFHRWGISETVQFCLEVNILGFSLEGHVEVFRVKKYNVLGVMWHPERELPFHQQDIDLVKDFFGGLI